MTDIGLGSVACRHPRDGHRERRVDPDEEVPQWGPAVAVPDQPVADEYRAGDRLLLWRVQLRINSVDGHPNDILAIGRGHESGDLFVDCLSKGAQAFALPPLAVISCRMALSRA